MMKFRNTLIIAVLLGALGAYAYFIEYKGGKKKEEAKEQEKVLLEIKKEDISEIRIQGLDKPVTITASAKDAWQLTSPLQARADESTVSRIFSAVEKLKYREIVEEQPKDLAAYELDKPQLTLRFLQKKGSERTILIGAKNPVDNVYYLRVDKDPRVYIVDSTVGDLTSITLLELRDKKLTDFSSDKAESLSLQTPALNLQFKKQNGVWKMILPEDSPASESEISSLLSSLESLRASRFIDEPASPADYGLDVPSATVDLMLEKGLRQKLVFGKKENDEIYCRLEGNPAVVSVSDAFTTIFDKKLEDWREKKLLVFNRFDAEEAVFKSAGKEYRFRKGEGELWNQLSPVKAEIESEKIQDLLEKLELAEISRYDQLTALSSAHVLEVQLTLKDWQEKVTKKNLSFGAVQGNEQQTKNADYSMIVWTQSVLQQEIEKALSEIKPAPPTPTSPAQKK